MPEVMINGPEGRLQARYHQARDPNAPIALMLHPHPQHGGTMNNKVIYTLYQSFRQKSFSVMRFNFRGVGRSQGRFDHGQGELSDAASVLDWLQVQNPSADRCWIAGFSFGAWIAMQVLMRRPEIEGFIAVSPPANMFDFTFLAPCPSSGLIVQGGADELVPEPDVATLAKKLQSQRQIEIDYSILKNANHFYENELDTLSDTVDRYLTRRLASATSAA
jgi:alpha/beta superfamily hydrolase